MKSDGKTKRSNERRKGAIGDERMMERSRGVMRGKKK
jgi:hypothetical protein